MIGGTTYEEARVVSLLNQDLNAGSTSNPSAGTRILLGGTTVHNSASFTEMIRSAALSFPSSVYDPPPEVPSNANAPSINLQLGNVNVSLGGPAGTGLYRTGASPAEGASTSSGPAGGIRDGVRSLFGKVKEGVDRFSSPS